MNEENSNISGNVEKRQPRGRSALRRLVASRHCFQSLDLLGRNGWSSPRLSHHHAKRESFHYSFSTLLMKYCV